MTTILRLKKSINNPDAPYLTKYDPIESRTGSLFLWDAALQPLSESLQYWDEIPNLLSEYAPANGNTLILGKGALDTGRHDQYFKRELTAKKALHIMVSQSYTGDTFATLLNTLTANTSLQDKMFNNVMSGSPDLYVSIWRQVTRLGVAGSGTPSMLYMKSVSSVSDSAFDLDSSAAMMRVGSGSIADSKLGVNDISSESLNRPNYHIANIKSIRGSGVSSDTKAHLHVSGQHAPWSAQQAINKSPSHAIYRIYIEDLKLSGRTYEEVKAIDDAEFTKAFAVGGRFHGDTWSNPATVLP